MGFFSTLLRDRFYYFVFPHCVSRYILQNWCPVPSIFYFYFFLEFSQLKPERRPSSHHVEVSNTLHTALSITILSSSYDAHRYFYRVLLFLFIGGIFFEIEHVPCQNCEFCAASSRVNEFKSPIFYNFFIMNIRPLMWSISNSVFFFVPFPFKFCLASLS